MNLKIIMLIIPPSLFHNATGQIKKIEVAVDTTITGFHYATNFSGTYVYTKNGISDIDKGNQPSAFSVTFSNKVSFEEAKKEVLNLLVVSYKNGYRVSDRLENDTILNGNQ